MEGTGKGYCPKPDHFERAPSAGHRSSVTVHGTFEVINSKHQITNKSQYPMTKTDLVPTGPP
jgi:hypothetical protein